MARVATRRCITDPTTTGTIPQGECDLVHYIHARHMPWLFGNYGASLLSNAQIYSFAALQLSRAGEGAEASNAVRASM